MYQLNTNPNQYPVDGFYECAQQAFLQLAKNTKTPYPLIGQAILAAMAYSTQRRVKVRRGPSLESKVALYLMAIADSGERKSHLEGLTTKAIWALEEEALRKFEIDESAQKVKATLFRTKKRLLETKLRRSLRNGKDTLPVLPADFNSRHAP